MSMLRAVCVLCACVVVCASDRSKREQPFYIYPRERPTELYLRSCDPNEVCNIVQKRHFKLRVRVLRKCRCAGECSTTPQLDNHTLRLNSHSYMKVKPHRQDNDCTLRCTCNGGGRWLALTQFCSPVTALPTCKPYMAALEVYNHTTGNITAVTTKALCNCPVPYPYWRETYHTYNNYFNGTIVNEHKYKCTEMKKCNEGDFCGYIGLDQYFMHYYCSCPTGTSCYYKDRAVHHIHVIMYTGPGYLAHCMPKEVQASQIDLKSTNC